MPENTKPRVNQLSAVCRLNGPQRHWYLKGLPAPKCHCRGEFLNHYVYIQIIMLPPAQKDAAWLPALAREQRVDNEGADAYYGADNSLPLTFNS